MSTGNTSGFSANVVEYFENVNRSIIIIIQQQWRTDNICPTDLRPFHVFVNRT